MASKETESKKKYSGRERNKTSDAESAVNCRKRKKLRYQYLEEVNKVREKSIFQLRSELERWKQICITVDQDKVLMLEDQNFIDNSLTNDVMKNAIPHLQVKEEKCEQTCAQWDQKFFDNLFTTDIIKTL